MRLSSGSQVILAAPCAGILWGCTLMSMVDVNVHLLIWNVGLVTIGFLILGVAMDAGPPKGGQGGGA